MVLKCNNMPEHATTVRSRSASFLHPAKKEASPFFAPVTVQPKLTVSAADDVYEREADATADKVMRMTNESISPAGPAPVVIQRKCAACEQEEHDIHRKETAASVPVRVSGAVHQTLQSAGVPLDTGTRTFMETRFGHNFSGVQVHTNSLAGQSAADINARAYTHGRHIVFADGQYQPHTQAGKQLLAHELTHVVQQGATGTSNVQRAPAADEGATCEEPLPPAAEWSGNTTLNAIRAEETGDNTVLVRRGQTGEPVQLVQQALRSWGCEELNTDLLPQFGADASFGAETESAVRNFQGNQDIAQDGLVGPVTLSRLDAFVGFGSIPEFPDQDCKVVPPDAPRSVIQSLADKGFALSSETAPSSTPAEESAFSAGMAGIPIFCQLKKPGGGGKSAPGLCSGKAQHVVKMGNATFALCDFIDGSRRQAGAIPTPSPGNQAGFVEMRALSLALFGTVQASLPNSGPGSAETDWEHGFTQTVQNLKYTAKYQRGWKSERQVPSPRRDATGASVMEPWYSNQTLPGFSFHDPLDPKKINSIPGPIGLGPESIGTDPVGIMDDPRAIFVDTVPINSEPECPCSSIESIEAKGELDTWLVVTLAGKGNTLSDLGFLKHAAIKFDLKADKAAGFAVQGTPTIDFENGQGSKTPVLTGTLANDDLKTLKQTQGQPCPVTIPSIKCPVESPKKSPAS